MRPIPKKLLSNILNDPYYLTCARKNGDCDGRITLEHALIYSGRQINEKFAIIPLCWRHHLGDKLDKRINRQIAMARASQQDKQKYSRLNWG